MSENYERKKLKDSFEVGGKSKHEDKLKMKSLLINRIKFLTFDSLFLCIVTKIN